MATLVAIKFPTVGGADTALKTLEQLQKQELTNLSHKQEEELHNAFSHDEETVAE